MKTLQEHLRDLYVSHGISHIQEAADRIDALEADVAARGDAQKLALTFLFEFQEATKCDSGAQAAERIKALEEENAALRTLVELLALQEGTAVFTTETHSRINAARSKT